MINQPKPTRSLSTLFSANCALLSPPRLLYLHAPTKYCGSFQLSLLVSQTRVLMSAQTTIWRDRVECVGGLGGEKVQATVCAVTKRESRQCVRHLGQIVISVV